MLQINNLPAIVSVSTLRPFWGRGSAGVARRGAGGRAMRSERGHVFRPGWRTPPSPCFADAALPSPPEGGEG